MAEREAPNSGYFTHFSQRMGYYPENTNIIASSVIY